MSLPSGQQRVLDAMSASLQRAEPRLAAKFVIFARLTRGDAWPAREQLPRESGVRGFLAAHGLLHRGARPRSVWPRILIATQVVLALALLALLVVVLHPSQSCAPGQSAYSAGRVPVACATTAGSVHPTGK